MRVIVDNPIKLGNVKFSQEDLNVTIGGVPIQMIRSYDSFKRNDKGDFGYGWTYNLANMDIKLNESRDLNGDRSGGEFDRDVTLTLPDGKRVTFASKLDLIQSSAGIPTKYQLVYESPENTLAKLAVEPAQAGQLHYELFGAGLYWDNLRPARDGFTCLLEKNDLPGFILTLDDGTAYHIQRHFYGKVNIPAAYDASGNSWNFEDFPDLGGVYSYDRCGKPYLGSIKLQSGDMIIFDYTGTTDWENPVCTKLIYRTKHNTVPVTYSDANAIEISCDAQGRIKAVYSPEQAKATPKIPTIKYDYDAAGNLYKVYKLVSQAEQIYETTAYLYSNTTWQPDDHFITDIKDSRGLSPIQYVYDEAGKLIATIDAKGNRIELSHGLENATGKYEEVKDDRAGTITQYYYNSRGNVMLVQKYDLNRVFLESSEYEYNDPEYLDGATKIKVPLVKNPGDDDYAITETDYDSSGRPIITVDPLKNVTETVYDSHGNVTWTIQGKAFTGTVGTPPIPNRTPLYDGTYNPVSKTQNTYEQDKLKTTAVWDPLVSSKPLSMTASVYDISGCLRHTINVNLDAVANVNEFYTLTFNPENDTIRSIYAAQHAVTSYSYSGNLLQPDSVTDAAGAITYYHYNANGIQDASWYYWDNPDVSGSDKWVSTVTKYDAQNRQVKSLRIIQNAVNTSTPPDIGNYISDIYSAATDVVVLTTTIYNLIDKMDSVEGEYRIKENSTGITERGTLTEYDYDEIGNLIETRTYNSIQKTIHLTTTRTLYDPEGKLLVTIGPYDPAVYEQTDKTKWPPATENVYDSLGKVEKIRKWQNAKINDFEDKTTYKKVYDGVNVRSAWGTNAGETGTSPAGSNYGWVIRSGTDAVTPVAGNESSYSRTVFDTAGRIWKTYQQDETGTEHCINEYSYDDAGKQTEIINNLGNHTKYEYDGTQRKYFYGARHYNPGTGTYSYSTEFSYDALGRSKWTKYPATTQNSITYIHTQYDGLGRKKFESEQIASDDSTSAVGKTFECDTAGMLKAAILAQVPDPENSDIPTNPRYEYDYDVFGNQTAIRDSIESRDQTGRTPNNVYLQ